MLVKKTALTAVYCLLASLPLCSFAQADFNGLVNAEKSFAQYSLDHSTKEAFLAFLADDGLIFRKGQPTNGKERWKTLKADSAALSWYPAFADIAASGELGFTTGPWEYRSTKADKEAAAFGNYITIWKKQADGSWKAAIDLGTSHGKPQIADAPVTAVMTPATNEHAPAASLTAAETKFITATGDKNANPYQLNSSPAVKIFRPGQMPYSTPQDADAEKSDFVYTMADSGIAKSGELGYVYGKVVITKDGKATTGAYLRIWKLHNKKWQLNLEVVSI